MANINIPIQPHLTNTPMDLGAYISKFVGIALILAAIVAFGYLVLSGIYWITAGGEEKKIEEAKNRITGAIIGLAIVACSWALFLIADSFFGLGMANKKTTFNEVKSSYSNESSSTNTNNNTGNTASGISFVCIDTTTCTSRGYCPSTDYATVQNTKMNCGSGKTGCSCVNVANAKLADARKNSDLKVIDPAK